MCLLSTFLSLTSSTKMWNRSKQLTHHTLSLRFEPHISRLCWASPSTFFTVSLKWVCHCITSLHYICHYLFTFISFQTCMTFFLLWNIKDYIPGNVPVLFSVWWQLVQHKLLGNTSYYFVHVLFNFFYWHKDDLHDFWGFLTLQFTI